MNEQIKQRTAQLNNGEVPNGYEKTEIGTFPVGWKTTTLDELLEFKNGVNADKEKYNSGVKMISVMDILTDSPIYYDKIKGQVDIDKKTLGTYSVTYGDILFQRSSETFEDAGKSNVYLDQDRTATYSGFVIRGKKKADYNPYFLNEALRIGQVRNQIIRNAAGSQHINVGQDSLAKIIVPLASDAEQSKIAEILMKWDEAIELQKQYITKIILRNGAVVDKLLSSKDNWKPLPLSTFVELKNGYAFKSETYINEGKYKIITIKNVKSGEFDLTECCTIDELPNNLQTHQLLSMGDIIISLTGNVGRACIVNAENCLLNQRVGKIVVKTISPVFVYEILQTNRFVSKMKNIAQGCAQANLSNTDVEDFVAFFPYDGDSLDIKTIDKISCILSEFRNELALQKELLNKLLLQRKALQQYLLNGIVRVEV